jgi:hypothetical protein
MGLALKDALAAPSPRAFKALLGFDGYVDSLYRPIQRRDAGGKTPFKDIGEFGAAIQGRAGISGGFELEKISVRLGGNAPLMAAALAALGVDVACVAALGLPAPEGVFVDLGKMSRLFSVAPAASTAALEFGDGKIMLNDTESLETLDWKRVLEILGIEKIRALAAEADLLALVNWANMAKATDLWKGLLEQGLEKSPTRAIFFDLADLSRCGKAESRELVGLLGRFRAFGKTTLGLNENEAWQLAEKFDFEKESDASLERLGSRILTIADVDRLVIHPRERALVFEGGKIESAPGRVVHKPLISTGGGDNFNAGFCAGLLMGLSGIEAAKMAVLVSSLYVEKGRSPEMREILELMP